ncbi:dihydroxyacetone kinase phosphoryl donor subunit DhaM [Selenomonas sp.]|uniref:dihydroxyacetone kinase phosphoryl donor subunit DhaM n=1 Tax=Selenomonas sp. TaxID=2053611 RepID=UPI003FA2A742
MFSIVIVSHSQKLAEGVVEVAKMMAQNVTVIAAGGNENGELGTSYEKIAAAINEVYTDDGTAILMDMGSAVMTAEIVLESMNERRLKLIDAPIVEGAILAAIEAAAETSLEDLPEKMQQARDVRKIEE